MSLLATLFFYRPSSVLILFALLAYPQLKAAIQGDPDRPEGYCKPSLESRINYGVMYLGLAAYLAIMSYGTYAMMAP